MKKLRFANGTMCISSGRALAEVVEKRETAKREVQALAYFAGLSLILVLLQWGVS